MSETISNPVYRFILDRGPAGLNRDYAEVRVEVLAATQTEAFRKAFEMSDDPRGRRVSFWVVSVTEVTADA